MGTASDKQRARYDWTTPDGRKRLDAAVSSLLSAVPRSRGEFAGCLGMDMTDRRAASAVTASLGRLRDAGLAVRQGDLGQSRYVAGKGGGR